MPFSPVAQPARPAGLHALYDPLRLRHDGAFQRDRQNDSRRGRQKLDASNNRIFGAARLMVSAAVVARDARRYSCGWDRRERSLLAGHAAAYFVLQPDRRRMLAGQIGHADFHPGAGYADRAHDEARWSFLMREHGARPLRTLDFCALAIRMRSGINRPWRLLAMDARRNLRRASIASFFADR